MLPSTVTDTRRKVTCQNKNDFLFDGTVIFRSHRVTLELVRFRVRIGLRVIYSFCSDPKNIVFCFVVMISSFDGRKPPMAQNVGNYLKLS